MAISKLAIDDSTLLTVSLRDVTQQRRQRERQALAELGAALAATIDYDETLACIGQLMVQDVADVFIIDVTVPEETRRRTRVFHRAPSLRGLCERFEQLRLTRRHAARAAFPDTTQPRLLTEVTSQHLDSLARDDAHLRVLQELAPRSLIVVPLLARGHVLGTLAFLSSRPSRRYDHDDLCLAEEVAQRAALAIENAALYADARHATNTLRECNEQLVEATIRAQELADSAEAARARAEESERELRQISEFRELFIGVVGHDLRNPLGAINMAGNLLLRQGGVGDKGAEKVALILRSSQRMTRMISQLLDLTRARLGGGFPLETQPADLRGVCRDVVAEFAAPIRLEVEGDVTGVWDPDRLAEALSNIIGNAIEHAAPGTPVVVRAHADQADVVVEIVNEGEPIPADVLPFIFEPFRRAQQHQKSPTGNLGLGLYIAKQIVQASHGTLIASSREGATTFSMRLPRQPPTAPQQSG